MLFDIGWSELLLIGVVALVFIGPKDLPRALRVAGYWVRRARTLSREFQSSIDQMIRDAELDEIRQDLKKATEFDIEKEFQKTVDPAGGGRVGGVARGGAARVGRSRRIDPGRGGRDRGRSTADRATGACSGGNSR